MPQIKWIKITTNIFDDEKIKLIDAMPERDGIFVIWIKLLTLAGRINNKGEIYLNEGMPYSDEMLSTIFNRPVQVVRLALSVFERFGMIEVTKGSILIANWEKHQNIDGMERMRELTKKRVIEFRKRKQNKALEQCNVTKRYSNAPDKIRLDKMRQDKIRLDEKKDNTARKLATPESLEAVYEVITDKTQAQDFWDYYTSNGWKVGGRAPMKDWRAAARRWARNNHVSVKTNGMSPQQVRTAESLKQFSEENGLE